MRILVLAQSAGLGGVESSLINFVRHLVRRGDHVAVVFWRDAGPVRDALPASVEIIDVQTGLAGGVYRTGGLSSALQVPSLWGRGKALGFLALRKILRCYRNPWILLNRIDEDFDVAIAFRHQGYGPYYLIDRVRARKKIMWYHHGAYDPSQMGEAVDRYYFGKMDAVVAVAEPTRAMLVARFPSLTGRVRVIPNIIDADEIRRKALEPVSPSGSAAQTGLNLLTVSRLSAEKGVDIAIRTARVLRDRGLNFTWHVIGEGPERGELQRLADHLKVEDNFVLRGESANPFPAMLHADLYVQTSRVEAHPLTIQEAMVLGKPIVASGIPSIAAVLEDGFLGVLSELGPEAFADAIEMLAGSSETRATFASRLAQHRPPNERVFAEIDELLAE